MARPGVCLDCHRDGTVHARGRCRPCYWRQRRTSAQAECSRCHRRGHLREATGWCGPCTRWSSHVPASPEPRTCGRCGRLRRHRGRGMCGRCLQADPDRVLRCAERLAARLPEAPPWLDGFAAGLAATRNASVAVGLLRELGRRLEHGHLPPAALLDRCRRDGRRSDGPLAKALEAFLVEQGLALRSDPTEQRAHHRRERLLTAVPAPLRAAVADFADAQLAARARAARAGTAMRSHDTIENDLAAVRDLARFLGEHIEGWEQVAVGHVETFLAARPALRARRLSSLRTFFRHCRRRRIVLTDATRGLRANFNPGFTGPTVPVEAQRRLFARWSGGEASGHESFVGLAALLHAASPAELKALCVEDVDADARTLRLGRRPRPVPVDPATWEALQRCRHERERTGTTNPHLLVTRLTKTGAAPVSAFYLSHVLDRADVTIRALRSTRLAALVTTGDPVLVAEAFGLHPRAILYYARDHVDDARLFPDRA